MQANSKNPPRGIAGTGIMGRGIAQAMIGKGLPVILLGRRSETFPEIRAEIERSIRMNIRRKRVEADVAESALQQFVMTDTMESLADCELVIEAIAEDFPQKTAFFRKLTEYVSSSATLCSNTSSLSVTELGRAGGCAERLAGLHFMNPVPASRMVELVKTGTIQEEHLKRARQLAEKLGLPVVECPDRPGFLVNRLLMPMIAEAARMLEAESVPPETIDTAVRLGCGLPMGPLALADMIGLDTVRAELDHLARTLGERFEAPTCLRRLVEEGRLGRKTGSGFFRYGRG